MNHAEIVEGIKRCQNRGDCESCERVLARQERLAMARAVRFAANGVPRNSFAINWLVDLAARIERGETEVP